MENNNTKVCSTEGCNGCSSCDKSCGSKKCAKRMLYQALGLLALFLTILTFVGIIIAIKSVKTAGSYPIGPTVVSFTGKGEVTAKPDMAVFSTSLTEDATTTKAAKDKLAARQNKIIEIVKSKGIKADDVSVENISTYPKTEYVGTCTPYNCNQKPVKVGYTISGTITIKIHNLNKDENLEEKASDVLSALNDAGIDNLYGPNYSIEDPSKYKSEARAKAIEDAKKQAEAVAQAVGKKLGDLTGFYDNDNSYGNPGPMYDSMQVKSAMAGAPSIAPQLPSGTDKVVSNVTVSYELK